MRTSVVQPSWITVVPVLMLLALGLASDDPHFTAVYSFHNMITFYERLRHRKLPPDANAQPEIKKRVCKEITGSQYFHSNGFEPIDPESDPWFKLLKIRKHADIFKQFFKKEKASWTSPKQLITGNYSYQNLYMSKEIRFDEVNGLLEEPVEDRPSTPGRQDDLDVSTLGKQPVFDVEHLFLCLTRRGNSTNEFQKWYVSKEYNSRARARRSEPAIATRFVFKVSESSGKFELEAVAGEAALEFAPPIQLEIYYVEDIRKNRFAAEKANQDPLCRLITDLDEHYRLCSAIMNSKYFLWLADRPDSGENVEHECMGMDVVLPQSYPHNNEYSEWMAACKARSRTGNHVHYYVSRAYRNDAVLVYYPTFQGKMSLVRMFTNVSIDDSGADILPRSGSNGRIQLVRPRSNNGRRNDTAYVTRSNSKGARLGN